MLANHRCRASAVNQYSSTSSVVDGGSASKCALQRGARRRSVAVAARQLLARRARRSMIQNINVRFLRGYLKPCLGIYAIGRAHLPQLKVKLEAL